MIIAHEVSGFDGEISVHEQTNILHFIEYAKMNPYSVYLCPGESELKIREDVLGMFEGRWPKQFKQERRLLPMRMAFIQADEIIPGNMEEVTRRLANSNRQIEEVVSALKAEGDFSHERHFSFWITTAASPVPESKLWLGLLRNVTDCAIRELRKLTFGTDSDREVADLVEGLYGVQTISTDLMDSIELSVMDEQYKAIFRAWPTTVRSTPHS